MPKEVPELQILPTVPQHPAPAPFLPSPAHPEEMTADIAFRMGDMVEFRARARCTPAGLVTGGLATAAILLATGYLVRAARSR